MMDQKRLFLAIGISVVILVVFQFMNPPPRHAVPPTQPAVTGAASTAGEPAPSAPGSAGAPQDAAAEPAEVPRLKIQAPRVEGSLSLLGGRIDDLVLRDYRETIAPDSPLVRLLEPRADAKPYYVQFGWTGAAGSTVKLPTTDTLWSGSGELAAGKPVTLSWDNGDGVTFEVKLSIDDNYMFSVQQTVRNAGVGPISVYPWARISRDYTPQTGGYSILHEGLVGILDGRLKEVSYSSAKSEGAKNNGVAFTATGDGGWAGITDKYWLTALVPDQSRPSVATFRHVDEVGGKPADRYQVAFVTQDPQVVAPGTEGSETTRLFAGAKEVAVLKHYQNNEGVPRFVDAIDWGWFFMITKPMFAALDWFYHLLGNFGLAIMALTICVKAVFFPLANFSYRSMSKMKLLGPKITQVREQYKDDPTKIQQQIMALYKAEKVNPASGCLPMLLQIPVFFSLYKVIFVTIEMRQAPFFGWIRDLSVVDPTNLFNLFGLIPFDPTAISPLLHLGAWPLIMGVTMYLQQKLNPPPPDPVQARLFQFMPIIFTFMLARFPAGLVIYWSWNNLLTIGQQWLIMRRTKLARPSLART